LHIIQERNAADEFHGKVVLPVVGSTGLIDRGDARMLESREGLSLSLEELDVVDVDVPAAPHNL